MPVLRNNVFFFLVAFWVGISMMPTFAAAQSQEDLEKIEQSIEEQRAQQRKAASKAQSLRQESESLRAELIALSQSVQQREATVTRLEDALHDLGLEEKQVRLRLEQRRGQSVETLMALQRLALNPPEAIIASPQEPADMVRSAILLRSVVPQIQAQAFALRQDLEAYSAKRTELRTKQQNLQRAGDDLDQERKRLKVLIAEKKALSAKLDRQSKQAQKTILALSRKAKSLKGLLEELESERKRQEALRQKAPPKKPDAPDTESTTTAAKPASNVPITHAKGKLTRPASGAVIMTFGSKEKLGGKHRGISIKTRKNAQLVAPYDGQVAFAGPFRGYKQLLIIDHGDGYHSLLTGMARIDATVGQWLKQGEPVALMPDSAQLPPLYFELRKGGSPIDPLPWVRKQTAKAQG